MRSHLTPSNNVKNILLPFNGMYHSFLDEQIDYEIENVSFDLTDEQKDKLYDYYNDLNLTSYHKLLTDSYSSYLIENINTDFNLNIKYSNIDYEPMNGMNSGDNLYCDIDVLTLPSIEQLADITNVSIDDVWHELQLMANDRFTSYDGFISFYDNDITPLKTANYELWQDVYISLVISYLAKNTDTVSDYDYYVNDIEQSFLDGLSSEGGSIELLLNSLDNDNCSKLNDLLYPDL